MSKHFVTNHPRPIDSFWPRRFGVDYEEGPPSGVGADQNLIGIYANMPREEFEKLPLVKSPKEMERLKELDPNRVVITLEFSIRDIIGASPTPEEVDILMGGLGEIQDAGLEGAVEAMGDAFTCLCGGDDEEDDDYCEEEE